MQAHAPQAQEKPFVEEVIECLRDAAHPQPDFFLDELHPDARNPDIIFDIQRFLVNRRFEMLLGGIDPKKTFGDTVGTDYMKAQLDARYCLLPQGSRAAWVKSFKAEVIPCLMKFQIPMVLQQAVAAA
jgi:hypothetical protein